MKHITILLGVVIVILSAVDYFALVSKKYCSVTCLQNYDGLGFNWLLLFTVAFLMSLVASLISMQTYGRWWRFARIALPAIFLITTVINLGFHHSNYGPFNMDNMFDIPALITLYTIFVVGSLVQIWRGYRSR